MTARWKRNFAPELLESAGRVFGQLSNGAWLCPECFELHAEEHQEAWSRCETWLEGSGGWVGGRPVCARCGWVMLVLVEGSPNLNRLVASSMPPHRREFLGSRAFQTPLGRRFRVSLWDANTLDSAGYGAFGIWYHAHEILRDGSSTSLGSGKAWVRCAVDSRRAFLWGLATAATQAVYSYGHKLYDDHALLDELDAMRATELHKIGAAHTEEICDLCREQAEADRERQRVDVDIYGP